MAAPTYVSGSAAVATTTSAVVAYPASLANKDFLTLIVSSDASGIGSPTSTNAPASGWSQPVTVQTGGGTSLTIFTAQSNGTETGNVTIPITSGTKGAAWMAARRAVTSGNILTVVGTSLGSDTDNTTTAISVTGGTSVTAAVDDLWLFAGLFASNPTTPGFTAGVSAATITQAGATLGTFTTRTSARTASNSLFYIGSDRPVTAGGTGAPAFTATAGGANASGSGIFLLVRETTATNVAPTANAGADQTGVAPFATVTLSGSGSSDPDGTIAAYSWVQLSGPTVTLSGANTATCTFTAPATSTGTTVVLGLTVTDNLGAASTQDAVSVTVTPHGEWELASGVWVPIRIYVNI